MEKNGDKSEIIQISYEGFFIKINGSGGIGRFCLSFGTVWNKNKA